MKCIIVKTTQTYKCTTTFYPVIVNICFTDSSLDNRRLKHPPDVVQVY